jgi:mannitol-specific phosphotransferase system IIBC component
LPPYCIAHSYGEQHKLYLVDALMAEVHAEVLGTISAFAGWMIQITAVVATHGDEMNARLVSIVSTVVELALRVLRQYVSKSVTCPCRGLLLEGCSTTLHHCTLDHR